MKLNYNDNDNKLHSDNTALKKKNNHGGSNNNLKEMECNKPTIETSTTPRSGRQKYDRVAKGTEGKKTTRSRIITRGTLAKMDRSTQCSSPSRKSTSPPRISQQVTFDRKNIRKVGRELRRKMTESLIRANIEAKRNPRR